MKAISLRESPGVSTPLSASLPVRKGIRRSEFFYFYNFLILGMEFIAMEGSILLVRSFLEFL